MSRMENSSGKKEVALRLRAAVEEAVHCIGLGYDLTLDLLLRYCKKEVTEDGSRLIGIDDDQVRDITIPGGGLVQNVPHSINCDKGERLRFRSDVLSFQQMSEQFNQELSLSSRIPTGQFNTAFEFTGCWQKDAAFTKSLAFDGVLITLYSIALEKCQVELSNHVKQALPPSWDPAALGRFIKKYGTHVIVGIKIGGKDVVYAKQHYSSPLESTDVQKILKDVADKRFSDVGVDFSSHHEKHESNERGLTILDLGTPSSRSNQEGVTFFWRRLGGSISRNIRHNKWCQTVPFEPEVVSMSFIPISSLLSGVKGNGFLSHAINLYLRYQPPIEELDQFLEFQLPRDWAPGFGDIPIGPDRKLEIGETLQFSLMGPKLYVNAIKVDAGNKPVTGMRLYLEGRRSNRLAIHLQHLSSSPQSFQLHNQSVGNYNSFYAQQYYEKVQWKIFSNVCTAPVESDDDLSIVTGAQFYIRKSVMGNTLFLRLHFSRVTGATVIQKPEWDGSPNFAQTSGMITLVATLFSSAQKPPPEPSDVNINSSKYPGGPPVPILPGKLSRFVDTREMTRGPQDQPGYWVVSGARLIVDKGKISLRVKYSLLAVILQN
ncbi:MACPF domain-containing protein At4g24290-like isoform X2 [Olea europaea var. sylvestris]|uniref:MACPF domain-containing protein At4g24290-like isoform X2 n=1 Tax=Olea europaea var. sylvestris TaxID=158386 RepID=UPI000C1D7CF8|nr:MACPF domain-containing protein At4g24290-like isoform X2 [Olea europaea var. sylvestris]